jgi:hypothetical protein
MTMCPVVNKLAETPVFFLQTKQSLNDLRVSNIGRLRDLNLTAFPYTKL